MGNIRLYGSTSGYTELAPPAVAPDGVLSLPSGTGTIAKTTDSGLQIVSPTSIANSGGSASASGGAVTFTGVSSVSLNGVFTSDYRNYRILINFDSGSGNLTARLRASGSDSTASYVNRVANISDSTFTGERGNNAALWGLASITDGSFCTLDVLQPQLALRTSIGFHSIGTFSVTSASANIGAGNHYVETAYDGFTIATTSMTGTIRVYGYKNS